MFLVVEISDTSLVYDLRRKAPLYVAGGIPEVWIVDLGARIDHVSTADGIRQLVAGDTLAPVAFPDLVLDVATDILG